LLRYLPSSDNITGFLLRATGEATQLELGFCGNLFEAPTILESLVTNSWIKNTWIALIEADIHLQVAIADIPYQRQGDIELV